MRWPDGFMWGTGASSTQCEGAAPASDWWQWERDGHAPISEDDNGFGPRYAEDFALFAGLGLTHHRDGNDAASCIARSTEPFLRPDTPDDKVGQVENVCFAQGLVLFEDRWHLYYGITDSKIGYATAPFT